MTRGRSYSPHRTPSPRASWRRSALGACLASVRVPIFLVACRDPRSQGTTRPSHICYARPRHEGGTSPGRNRPSRGRVLAALATITAWAMPGLPASAIASATTTSKRPPVVLSFSASPGMLPPAGGVVMVRGRVKLATVCQLRLLSRQSFPVIFSHDPTSRCRNGTYSARVTIGANPSPVRRSVAFALMASKGASSSAGRFYVDLAAPLAPKVLSLRTSPIALPPGGGQVTVTARVEHATSCQLRLLSKQSFPVVYASNARPCSLTFTAHVMIAGNGSPVRRTVAFALVARGSSGTITRYFYVALGAFQPTPATTTVPAATTTVPPAATTTVPPAATTNAPAATTTTNAGSSVLQGTR